MAGAEHDAALRLLVIEDNVAHARVVRTVLESMGRAVDVHHAGRLASGCERLRAEPFDVVLVDLHLPDGQGPDVVAQLVDVAPSVPMVVISALDDPAVAHAAMAAGAHDYLTKDRLTPELVSHALVRAMQRAGGGSSVAAALADPATGVFNRRGLELAATKAVAFARRQRHPVTVVHLAVEATSAEVAELIRILAATVRDADLVGRLGPGHVAIVLPDDRSDPPAVIGRIEARLAASPLAGVALGIEVRRFDPQDPIPAHDLLRVSGGAALQASSPVRRVLLVFDDPARMAEVRGVLGEGFWPLEATGSGPAARLAALEEPQLAIVDLGIDGGQWTAVVRRIAEQAEAVGLPIIGIGEQLPGDQFSGRAGGLSAVVAWTRIGADLTFEVERALR